MNAAPRDTRETRGYPGTRVDLPARSVTPGAVTVSYQTDQAHVHASKTLKEPRVTSVDPTHITYLRITCTVVSHASVWE